MANPILVVHNAGRGETPPCAAAKFQRGDVVKVRNTKTMRHFPREAVVLAVVPPGFSVSYALADLLGQPRPLMVRRELRCISYIIGVENDTTPYHARESSLLPSGKPPVTIGAVRPERES
jgi:hypothetical protein